MRRKWIPIVGAISVAILAGVVASVAASGTLRSPITASPVPATATSAVAGSPTFVVAYTSPVSIVASAMVPTLSPNLPSPPQGPPPTPDPNGAPLVGTSAIIPRTTTADPATPAFTAQDAANYVSMHPVNTGRALANGTITVAKVSFQTVRDINAQLGMGLYLAPDRLICLVQESGAFTVTGPAGYNRDSTIAYELFDAHTGNYLGLNVR